MYKLCIRPMTQEDLPQVLNIEKSSFTAPWSEASFLSELYNRYAICRAAEVGKTIAGYICVRQISDECHIMNLAVHSLYRRKGIASLMLRDVLGDLRSQGHTALHLEVRSSNIAAQNLYTKFGFSQAGLRKNYYTYPSEDAVLMLLRI
ncbi:MAG: ribosomal protein S18-alanine N-acetyltransferase [Nitrospiraceae bacterium]|nr:ribosomal protein S18-alanine N-acetyltransferase [Nitrospiraceae bacterium]